MLASLPFLRASAAVSAAQVFKRPQYFWNSSWLNTRALFKAYSIGLRKLQRLGINKISPVLVALLN